LLVFGTLGLSFALDSFAMAFESPYSAAADELGSKLSQARGLSLAAALLGFALVPGIAEELLCRGVVQRGLQAHYRPWKAILLASLFFGALHMNLVHSALASVLGLYLGAIAYYAGSVRASILCHTVNNAAAVLGGALQAEFPPVPGLALLAAAAFSLGALGYARQRANALSPAPLIPSPSPDEIDITGLQRPGGSDDP
jgi:membrane protease YdiL (CAAX protease family)